MTKIASILALALFLLPEATFAANQYSWHVIYRVVTETPPSTTSFDRQGGPFSDPNACFTNQNNAIQQIYAAHPSAVVTAPAANVLCSCHAAISAQTGDCPTSPDNIGNPGSSPPDNVGNLSTPPDNVGNLSTPPDNIGNLGGSHPSVGLRNPLSAGTNLEQLLADILRLVVRIGTIVIILMLVYIGYLFATTSIEPDNKNKAKEALLWTVVGALILLGAQAIASGIEATVQAISAGG